MARVVGVMLSVIAGCGRIDFSLQADADDRALCDRVGGVIYCNDFEGGALPGVRTSGGSGIYTYVRGGGFLGTDGYRFDAQVPGDRPVFQIDLPAPITFGEFHIGGRMLVSTGAPVADYAVIAEADFVGSGKVSFDLQTDRAVVVNTVAAASSVDGAAGSFPRGRWSCFELVVFADGAGGSGYAAVTLDGVPTVEGFDGLQTVPAGGYTQSTVGLVTGAGNTEPLSLMLDNWIVSTSLIGCP